MIPSQPSDIQRIITGVEEVIANLKQINTRAISDELQGALKEAKVALKDVQGFFGGPKTKRLIAQLEGIFRQSEKAVR